MNNNVLLKSANYYDALKSYEYEFVLGKKKSQRMIRIVFPSNSYHHLAGFQYVTQDSLFISKKMAIYHVKTHKITQERIASFGVEDQINNRCAAILQIQRILDNNRIFYEYHHNGPRYSNIKAQFVLIDENTGSMIMLFLNGKNDSDMIPCSIIMEDDPKYYAGYTRWTTLKITKIDHHLNCSKVIYRSGTYLE